MEFVLVLFMPLNLVFVAAGEFLISLLGFSFEEPFSYYGSLIPVEEGDKN
jgi:hypothetical protein